MNVRSTGIAAPSAISATLAIAASAVLLLAAPAFPAFSTPLLTQEHGEISRAAVQGGDAEHGAVDIIMPHITDGSHMEVPWPVPPFYREVHLPEWEPIHIGGIAIDLSPSKHVVMLIIAALLCLGTLVTAAVAHRRHHHAIGTPKGFAAGIESMVLYLRNEVVIPNVGPDGDRYVPFALTLFFFILYANLLGLIPYGSTATGNISVTATLAILSFVMIEIAGMRSLGKAYIGTIIYWPHDVHIAMRIPLSFIMTPVEIIGKFTKPFALTIRLFANMIAGHVIVLALIGLIFTFQSWVVAPLPFIMALAIMLLEVLVAFIQAFIFALLSCVFIGQIRTAHH